MTKQKEIEQQKHVNLSIGCNGGENRHASFYVNEKNRMICEHCKDDMTPEMDKIYNAVDEYLDNVKK